MIEYYLPQELKAETIKIIREYTKICHTVKILCKQKANLEICLNGVSYANPRVTSSNISNPTVAEVMKHEKITQELNDAILKKQAVEKGFELAMANSHIGDRFKLLENVKKNLIEEMPREWLDIAPATLSKYRNRAIYNIAIKLGLWTEI